MNDILKINSIYLGKGYNTVLLLLGDVFDSSVTKVSEAMQAVELFRFFCNQFVHCYSVVGNHEITYARDNPFWYLVSKIEDASLSSIERYIQPCGLTSTIAVPGIIFDGEVSIAFNHYGLPAKVLTTGETKIGLFHQNVGSNDICKMWGTFDNVEEANYIQSYNYCFFGHMHLAKGKYFLNDNHTCRGEWLGTIGRTKVTEVLDDSLDVNIPVILVEDGKFCGIQDNTITLKSFSECVDVERLKASEESKRAVAESKEVAIHNFKGTTLYETLLGSLAGSELATLYRMLSKSQNELMYWYNLCLSDPERGFGAVDEEDGLEDE